MSNYVQTLSDVAETIPQLLWRPRITFAYDGTESIHRRLKRLHRSWDESRSAKPAEITDRLHRLAIACMPHVSATIAGHLYGLAAELALQNKIVFERPDYDLNRSLTQEESGFVVSEINELQTGSTARIASTICFSKAPPLSMQ